MPVRRLYVVCEGRTEEAFVASTLSVHFRMTLAVDTIALVLPNRVKSTDRRHKGGWLSYAVGRRYVVGVLSGMHAADVWVTTMLDFYAIPDDFPALKALPQGSPRRRVEALEAAFAADVGTDRLWRFTPHLQLHEFEALLLTDIDAIGRSLTRDDPGGVARLKADIAGFAPEEVDDGRDTAPSKRIIRHFPSYAGLKTSAGPLIAADIGLPRLRAACPHFGDWLTTLERRCRE